MDIHEMIDRCGANQGGAWPDLWRIVETAARASVERILAARNEDPSLADDILQNLYIYLRADDLHYLRAFRGQGVPQFQSFVRTLAAQFAVNMLRKTHRAGHQEADEVSILSAPDRSGPTEREVLALLHDLESLMSIPDRVRLRRILATEIPHATGPNQTKGRKSPSPRTLRRWQEELYRKYHDRIV